MKKRILCVVIMILACIGVFVGCSKTEKNILVISREAGSGTRSAFEELLNIKADAVKPTILMDKTNNVITEVSKNKYGIGYISLGSLNNSVKPLKIEGVACSAENVLNNTYKMARPFELVSKKGKELSAEAKDFANYIISSNAQKIITTKGYVSIEAGTEYKSSGVTGKLKISGSTSVEPLLEALFADYHKFNTEVTLEMTANGSGTGIADAKSGSVDFGMSSRAIKTEELNSLDMINLCKDGIAVIVNDNNAINNITIANLNKIYSGEIVKFSQLA